MNFIERMFHAFSFELIALAIIVPVVSFFSGTQSYELAVVGIGMSVFAVAWNYVYNLMFDRWYGARREERSAKLRVLHALGFEGGLIFFTIPLIAWYLQVGLLAAVVIEGGFLVFFFFYTTIFNWLYDKYQPYQWLFSRGANSDSVKGVRGKSE
ncbi:PACE efflux transporter [Vibrio sp. ZSDZ34]|uniref:PACE efflux transporter n=1 Tax=Vibrio gelatinilyticus TaxID=2893468 RepID=A0A9X2AZI2_9VIBR|nr:PACE efflux transporter [Vibrio gelatinilyticus]MCJ2377548.1 PACE efflux transporter [Vibrio gelatinilyticus]